MSQERKPMTTIAVLILLGCTMFVISFATGLIAMENKLYASDSFSDSFNLSISDNRTFEQNITTTSILTLEASANGTFETNILYDGNLAFSPIDQASIRNSYQLFDLGYWTIRFRNISPTTIELTYRITVTRIETSIGWPYLWLRLPLFAIGVISLLLTVPAYFSSRFTKYVKRKDITTIIAVIVVLMILLSYQIAGLALNTSAPWIVVQGTSMEPNLHEGDLVFIQGFAPEHLIANDIILYNKIALNLTSGEDQFLQAPILHRIIYEYKVGNRWYFQAQGDNNTNPDSYPIPESGVLGKVVYVVPKIGYVIGFLTRIDVKIALIAAIALLYFIVPKAKLAYKKKREQGQLTS